MISKRRSLLLVVLFLLFLTSTASGASNSITDNISATIYPNLTLYFKGEKELPSTEKAGYYWTGSEWVPKVMIVNGTTYVPLRYFSNKMGIPNEQIGWDSGSPSIWVGSEKPAELVKQPAVIDSSKDLFGLSLHDSGDRVKEILGEPSRIDYEGSGQYWSYTNDYVNYVLVYLKSDVVKGILTTSKNGKYGELNIGMSTQEIEKFALEGTINNHGVFHNKQTHTQLIVGKYMIFLLDKDTDFYYKDKDSLPLRVFDVINGIRVSQGVPPLAWNENAAKVAEEHSKDLQATHTCGHDSSNGDDITKRKEKVMAQYGFSFGENVVCERRFLSSIGAWLGSPGHLKNMLSAYRSTGIGISGGTYTQIFLSTK